MEKEYYVRGKKIKVEELPDVLAVKVDPSVAFAESAEAFGAKTKLSTDNSPQDALNKQQEIFEKAGYIFVKPNEQTRSAFKSRAAPNSKKIGTTFVDSDGNIKIGTRKLMVKFKPGLGQEQIDSILNQHKLKIINQLKFANSLFEVEVQNNNGDPLEISVQLHNNENVIYAEPLFNEHIPGRYKPTDPKFNEQWQWAGGISIQKAWDKTKGEGIKLALIDNGIDVSNPDLSQSMMPTAGYFKDDGIGQTVFVKDTNGFPDGNHGTFCSGMAIAKSDNGKFGCGAANNASFIPIACLGDQVGSQVTLARSIAYAADPTTQVADASMDDGADIISCSLGPNGGHWVLESVLEDAIIFATSKGRHGLGTPIFWAVDNSNQPVAEDEVCSHPNTIAVGRARQDDTEDGSAFGPELDFIAPGVNVFSTYSGGDFDEGTGTSYATPCAAGIGALILSANPKLSWDGVRKILRETCDKVGGVDYGTKGHHPNYGYGRINAAKAVDSATQSSS
jgi:subtilisin family serine protease